MKIWIAILLLAPSISQAVQVDELSLNYRRFYGSIRMPEVPSTEPKEGLNLGMNLKVLGPLFWKNRVVSISDNGGFRMVGWNFKVGAEILGGVDIEMEHFSRHLLDRSDQAYATGGFPVENSVGVTWYILRGKP